MTDQSIPSFVPDDADVGAPVAVPPIIRGERPRASVPPVDITRERKRSFLSTLDMPLLMTIGILLAFGLMMVYSTTFDWSYQDYGNEFTIFLQHARNVGLSAIAFIILMLIDYRIWRRFAVLMIVVTFGLLVGVLVFGDNTFGARRAFFNGSYQPGELAELTIIIYMAAWLSSKSTRIKSLTHGLLPYAILIGSMCYLIIRQPDMSTAVTILGVSLVMLFLAGASLVQLGGIFAIAGMIGVAILSSNIWTYANERVDTFLAASADLTQANHHVREAIIAFVNGGWTGVGLGQGKQKFGFLPAPHTDSIFAVIGEELGVVGAAIIILLYIVLVTRGFMIANRAPDMFGTLLASGVTIWVAAKALLNIAVMTAVVPATGAPLPFISFGGSSMMVMMAGAGILLSVGRVTARVGAMPIERRVTSATSTNRSRGDRRTRLSRVRNSGGDSTELS